MASLYTTVWKTFVRSLIKLLLKLWSFILYLRSFNSRSTQHFFTPKPHSNKQLDVDLEGGRAASLHPRSNGLPFTSTLPSPCVRRPRATTLAAYYPPCTESTPRMAAIVSRSSALSLSAVENDVITNSRLSEDSFFSALSTCSEEPSSDAGVCYRTLELDSDKPLMPSERVEETKLIRQRDSAHVDMNKIKGTGSRRQMSLPSKCLSPLKTLSLVNSRLEESPEPTQATSASLIALNDPASNHQIGYLEYSCSVDRGLSMMQQLPGMTQYDDEKVRSLAYETLARRPWSIASHVLDHQTSNMPLKGNLCSKLEGNNSDPISKSPDTLEPKQVSKRCQSGFGLHDVSYVKGMFSLMRADVEQDELSARNIFNRESVLTYRKSAIHSKGAKFRSRYLSANVQNDKIISSVNRPRTHRKCISQASLAISRDENVPPVACGDGSIRLDCFRKPALETRKFRFRYRSATHGLDASPSMQLQFKVEKIKRQRKVRQEMMARTKLLYSRQSNRYTYEWFAEDIQIQDCES